MRGIELPGKLASRAPPGEALGNGGSGGGAKLASGFAGNCAALTCAEGSGGINSAIPSIRFSAGASFVLTSDFALGKGAGLSGWVSVEREGSGT